MDSTRRGRPGTGVFGWVAALSMIVPVVGVLEWPGAVYAESTLRGFERDATQPAPKDNRSSDNGHHSHDGRGSGDDHHGEDSGGSFFGSLLGALLGGNEADPVPSSPYAAAAEPVAPPVADQAATTAQAPMPPQEPYVWQAGSGFTPRLRIDYGQMTVSSRIGGETVSVEGGDDHLGLLIRDTQFKERDPDATLRLREYLVLWRITGAHAPELDLGIGGTELTGIEENSGFAYLIRLRALSHEGWAFEGRYGATSINGNELSDSEAGVSLEYSYVALRGGYRWLKSPNILLDGPYLGISLRY